MLTLLDQIRMHLNDIDTFQAWIARGDAPEDTPNRCQLIHERSFLARGAIEALLHELGYAEGTMRLSQYDLERAGMRPANE